MNSNQIELTEEQENQAIRDQLNEAVRYGKSLDRLKKNPDFKALFQDLFMDKGLKILWENIRHLEESQMIGRGSDKNLEIIEAIKGQVKTRLDFNGFMDTVENDAFNAMDEIAEIDKEDKEENDNA